MDISMVPGKLKHCYAVEKGWSGERKYFVQTDAGRFLLRISDKPQAEVYAAMSRAAATGIPMAQPVAFGSCQAGEYLLLTWVDGESADSTLPALPRQEQYRLGRQAGESLRRLHSIPAPKGQEAWQTRFNRKIDRKIAQYEAYGLRYENDAPVLAYLAEHRSLLKNRPQSFQHGDYHCGNMILSGGQLSVIDFHRLDYGDPWEEFSRIVWCAAVSPDFAAGRVDGYFEDEVPEDFWPLLALYIASNTLSSLPWAIPFGDGEIRTMRAQMADIMNWYENMTNPVPAWYRER